MITYTNKLVKDIAQQRGCSMEEIESEILEGYVMKKVKKNNPENEITRWLDRNGVVSSGYGVMRYSEWMNLEKKRIEKSTGRELIIKERFEKKLKDMKKKTLKMVQCDEICLAYVKDWRGMLCK